MARMPRFVFPGCPHHVTQRGNRRMQTFFCEDDYRYYLDLVAKYKSDAGVDIWAYCLMPNHVHLVAVPEREDSLATLFREVHRRYTRQINYREHWKGHLWQERFHSFAMDEQYLHSAVRYVELNPVSARLVKEAALWRWSSAGAHLLGFGDEVVNVQPMLERIDDWRAYLARSQDADAEVAIRRHSRTGRPAGSEDFLNRLEALSGRELRPKKPGRKPRK